MRYAGAGGVGGVRPAARSNLQVGGGMIKNRSCEARRQNESKKAKLNDDGHYGIQMHS